MFQYLEVHGDVNIFLSEDASEKFIKKMKTDEKNDKNLARQTLKHSDLSSRHPVILGLRNILKSCINHNIQTLTFPLLLTHEMTDEMVMELNIRRVFFSLKNK